MEGSNRSGTQQQETVYIKVPLSQLFHNEISEDADPINSNLNSKKYKLIDGCPSDTNIVRKKHTYVVAYDDETNNAKWVYEILNKSTLADNTPQKMKFSSFKMNEGYHQGHLAAAANHLWCQEAYNSTFVFSNFSPQLQTLNNGCWKALEVYCQNKIKEDEKKIRNVHVYTGPIILQKAGTASEDVNSGPELKEDGAVSETVDLIQIQESSKSSLEQMLKKRGGSLEQILEKKGSTLQEILKMSGSKLERVLELRGDALIKMLEKMCKTIEKKVPDFFFKVIIVEKKDETVEEPECYLIPNDEEMLKDNQKVQTGAKQTTTEFVKQTYKKSVKKIQDLSGLTFTDESFKGGEEDSIRTVTWTGEDGFGETRTAEIEVRINKPQTSR